MDAPELPLELEEYFLDTPIEVLRSFSDAELLQAVDKRDRLSLMTFLKAGGFKAYVQPLDREAFQVSLLNLKSKASSDQFAFSDMALSKVFAGLPDLQPNVKILDLRMNNLFDSDLGTIASFIATARFPNLQHLLLQHNRIAATQLASTAILTMLGEHPQLQIAITGNALATIDATTLLFGKLTLEQSQRLIFISENHLTARHWKAVMVRNAVLNNDSDLAIIEASHRQFYLVLRVLVRL